MNRVVQLLVSAGLATVVVLVMMVTALWAFGIFDREDEVTWYAHPVEVLSQSDRLDIARLLGEPERRTLPEMPPMREIPPMEVPERTVSGFVQLEVEVDPEGRVQRAEVVNAMPLGVYEEQALRQVRQRRYPPREGGGSYVEVVPFSVSPPAPRD
jgi:TonB family protein